MAISINRIGEPKKNTHYNNFVWVYSLLAFYSLIANFHPLYNPLLVSYSVLLIFIYIIAKSNTLTSSKSKKDMLFFLGIYGLLYVISAMQGCSVPVSLWILTLFGASFLFLKKDIQLAIFNRFIKLYCWLMIFSMIEYAVFLLTGFSIVIANVERVLSVNSYPFDLTFFNLIMHPLETARFQSLLHEPGDIGTLNGLLIFGLYKKEDYRRFELPVIIASGLMAMSLAFLILLGVFLAMNALKMNIKLLIGSFLLLLVIGFGFRNQVEQAVIYRVTEVGVNQRSEELVVDNNIKSIKNFQLLGRGYGSVGRDTGSTGAGAHEFIYDFGWMGLILLFFLYWGIYRRNNSVLDFSNLVFFIAFALSFYQRQNIYEVPIVMAFLLPSLVDCENKGIINNLRLTREICV